MSNKKQLRVFIVDDNQSALQILADDLREQPEIGDVATYTSYSEAMLPLLEEQPDVLFMDVEMPGKSGLEFLESVHDKIKFQFKVVFYSGFSEYMLDAIRMSAFDFLLKPYKKSELRGIIERLTADNKPSIQPIEVGQMPKKIAIQTVSELLLVTKNEILMFAYQSDARAWKLTLTDLTCHTMKKGICAEDLLRLHSALARISNTTIINLTYLAAVENNTQRCRFCPPFNEIEIKASRRYFSKLKEHLELL